ncbi:hypothetical protein EfmGK941_29580 (plasmid) [Enterococcus faecium]|nr:hypothetical protein EfmGK941_29580 [Enterococcus faecium]
MRKNIYLKKLGANINISEISKKYGITRYKALKYIEDAREKQLVSISINSPYARI